jgi:type I restriction enzyme R subunit
MLDIDFDEVKQSQLPLAEMLINMGYRYIPIEEVLKERRQDTNKMILKDTAFQSLKRINNKDEEIFSDKNIVDAITELEEIPLEGLIDTSRKIYQSIMPKTGGKTIKVYYKGESISKSFKFIDFENIENNDFSFTVEFEATGKSNIRPDIVIFVNGIPLSIIENKKSSEELELAITQHNRNQGPDKCPKLFIYPQLLIATNKDGLKYGTTGTPNKFYAGWRERDVADEEWKRREHFDRKYDEEISNVISKKIDNTLYDQILRDLNGRTRNHKQKTKRLVTEQDRGVYGLLRRERLLDISKNYVLYDGGLKKVMRYQQVFAVKRALRRIRNIEKTKTGERREGGILWQTQGSGKSLTMVMFVKALIEDPEIKNPRILVVTDRRDLDRQIKGTFENAGLKKEITQAKSGRHLLKLIKSKSPNVITTLVFKFGNASELDAGFLDTDKNIFVLIDEVHRSQGGEANLEMNRTIPNACYIGFTGTPILKERKSENQFGRFIDKYTIDDGLNDEIVLPLIYEGRYVDLRQDKEEIDRQVKRLTADLNKNELRDLQKHIEKKAMQETPSKIVEIGYDIAKHYTSNFAGSGLKAQIVAPSKYAATLFQKYFENETDINTALVISDEDGLKNYKDSHRKEVEEYLKEIKDRYQSLQSYEKQVIDSFQNNEDGIEILIVVDKLLTGFDAPRNTVLYLTKELKDHNLLQAIARVNRLFENDVLPKTAGYIIDYSENAKNLETAMQLFGNYDEEDVKGTLIDVDEKIKELEDAYSNLHDSFKGVQNDDEAYLQYLEDEPTRKEFYENLNEFVRVFNECIVLREFVNDFDDISTYKMDLKKYANLRKTASLRFSDAPDFGKYKQALINILDKNIKAEEAELLTRQISITDKEAFKEAVEELGSAKSKAEAIGSKIQKEISERMKKDPEFYRRFSDKIEVLLQEMREKKLADIEALKQINKISEQVLNKEDEDLPVGIKNKSGSDIFYRNLVGDLKKYGLEDKFVVNTVLEIYEILEKETVIDWQINAERKRVMRDRLDDYFYDVVKVEKGVDISSEEVKKIIDETMVLAQNNYEIL